MFGCLIMDDLHVVPAQEIYIWEDLEGQGYSDERLEDEVNLQAQAYSEIIDKGGVDYISAWHFTSHRLKDCIDENGLMTRENTDMPAQHSGAPSHQDKVYFTTEEGYLAAGKGMASKIGGRPIAFQAFLNPDNLKIDEDTELMHDYSSSNLDEEDFYLASIATFGNIAHLGNIYPDRESAPEGESFLVGSKEYDEMSIQVPELVRKQFNSRMLSAGRNETSENVDEIRKQLESIRSNFDTQISMKEARKLLENQK